MLADYFFFSVVKVGLGSLQGPGEFSVRRCLAGVDLRSDAMGPQDYLLASRGLDRIGHVGPDFAGWNVLGIAG